MLDKQNMGIIICGFAGIGKTTLQENYLSVIDLESSDFKWIYQDESLDKETRKGTSGRVQNPLWPKNYVRKIIEKTLEYEIVLVSQDLDLRNCLKENGCEYYVCFPKKECKQEYIERYKNRSNNENFISFMSNNFENWIDSLMGEKNVIIMESGEYLEETLIRYGLIKK